MTYPGGKAGSGAAHRIVTLMPPHNVYIEPFAGSAAVARLKREAHLNIIIETDPPTLELARTAALIKTGESSSFPRYRHAETGDVAGELAKPGEATRSKKRSRIVGLGEPRVSPDQASGAGDHRWIWLCGDGLEFIENHQFTGDELVYCDPPYVRSTRKSSKDIYKVEWTDHHHSHFLTWACNTKARVIISGYASSLYAKRLHSWETEKFEAMTRRGPATETLWWNFPRPAVLHDDRFLGNGFRERERIRRQQARWVTRLERMPAAERHAIINAVRSLASGPSSKS